MNVQSYPAVIRRLGLALVLLSALAAANGPSVALAAFASVTVQFTNSSDRTLTKTNENLDHGCWQTHPPDTIAPGATVSWESVSCGFLTATEGEADYQIGGEAQGTVAHFHWDDPTCCINSADASAPAGYTVPQPDFPNHGLNITVTFNFRCSSTTCDGIPDDWKRNGVFIDNTTNQECGPPPRPASCQFVDLPNMGANVNKPDIFLQVDWMADLLHSHQLSQAAIQNVVTAFANSPYRAVNGAIGINLHVDEGANSVNFPVNLSKARQLPHQVGLGSGTINAYNWTRPAGDTTTPQFFQEIKDQPGGFTSTGRTPIFHYVIAAHSISNLTNSGVSRGIIGSDYIVSLGACGGCGDGGNAQQQAGTLMHELGHNLGLQHGGGDGLPNKPNYFSVMNYDWQFNGLIVGGVQGTLDYSRSAVPPSPATLNESSLNESGGLGTAAGNFGTQHWCPAAPGVPAAFVTVNTANGPIDWNCNGKTTDGLVGADSNGDGTRGSLAGYNDWANIFLRVGAVGGGLAPLPTQTPADELSDEQIALILPSDTTAPVTTAMPSPAANANGWNNTDVTVTLTATDDISGVALTEFNLDGTGWTPYTTPFVISAEGVHMLLYRSADRSQNVETAKSLTVRIDKTPPSVVYTGNLGTYHILDTVNITCTASDALSGVSSTTCQNVTGPAYNFNPGTNTFSATATDLAGNAGSGSTSFNIVVTYSDLCTLSKRFVTNAGVAHSNDMCAQLNAAQIAQAHGNLTAKANAIAAYLNDVDAAVRGGFLSPSNAAILIKLAGGL